MKYLFIGVFTLLCLFACQSNDSKYIIEGTLPTAQQDGEWIYLAPMENASIENIDSTRIETQAFNYAFMKEHINQTVGKFLYKMIKTSLTEEQRKELDEANH